MEACVVELKEALDSINKTKQNIIRDSHSPEAAEKQYPRYPVQRCMSFHIDTLMAVNELNIRGLEVFKLTNRQHYEYLLHCCQRGNRFAPWEKPKKDDARVEVIKTLNKTLSTQRAREYASLLTDDQFKTLKKKVKVGGTSGT